MNSLILGSPDFFGRITDKINVYSLFCKKRQIFCLLHLEITGIIIIIFVNRWRYFSISGLISGDYHRFIHKLDRLGSNGTLPEKTEAIGSHIAAQARALVCSLNTTFLAIYSVLFLFYCVIGIYYVAYGCKADITLFPHCVLYSNWCQIMSHWVHTI